MTIFEESSKLMREYTDTTEKYLSFMAKKTDQPLETHKKGKIGHAICSIFENYGSGLVFLFTIARLHRNPVNKVISREK